MEAYYRLCADEGATEEDVAKSKAAMSSMQVIIGDVGVLRKVAKDIIQDYQVRSSNTDRLQKAMRSKRLDVKRFEYLCKRN